MGARSGADGEPDVIWAGTDSWRDCVGGDELVFLGDVALAGPVEATLQSRGPHWLFEPLPREFLKVQALCLNLECCLSERGTPWEPKPVHLRGDPSGLDALPMSAGRTLACVANNHFLDYGEDAARDTLTVLSAHSILPVGTADGEGRTQSRLIEVGGAKVGLLAFAPCGHMLPAAAHTNLPNSRPSAVVAAMAEARRNVDILIVILHQGVEYCVHVDKASRRLSHICIDHGADLVVCHHPHVVQATEAYRGKLIFHSIGSSIMGTQLREDSFSRWSLAVRVLIESGRIARIVVIPMWMNPQQQVVLASELSCKAIERTVKHLSGLLKSRPGTCYNYLRAGSVQGIQRASGALGILKRKGLRQSVAYYGRRMRERIH